MSSTYAIGDIQGCFTELSRLVEMIEFDATCDRLWFVGDLVNRGEGSLETLRYVKSLGDAATVVLGNHDLHLLAVAEGFRKMRDDDTLSEILDAPDRDELLAWLRFRPLLHMEDEHVLVHAGLLPQWDIHVARARADEVETALRAPEYRTFLADMYGSKPDMWQDDLHGPDRLRVIVNAMTRMRFCSAAGQMEFRSAGELENPPTGFVPWFQVPDRASQNVTVICGHWSALGLHIEPNLLALDTGCVWGKALTAVRLEDRRIYQVQSVNPAAGEARLAQQR